MAKVTHEYAGSMESGQVSLLEYKRRLDPNSNPTVTGFYLSLSGCQKNRNAKDLAQELRIIADFIESGFYDQ